MELYVYETPAGAVADFRPYLDGYDHSFDDHRALGERDPRWEKVRSLVHPVTKEPIAGQLEFVGTASCNWRELMLFPIVWDREYTPVELEGAEEDS